MTATHPSEKTTLSNWREHPFNRWSFTNVDTLVNGKRIQNPNAAIPFNKANTELDLGGIILPSGKTAQTYLNESYTDAFIALDNGAICSEQYYGDTKSESRHILFSITKSVIGTLAGILILEGRLSPDKLVSHYIPELSHSAWGDATVDQVLDMLVSVNFGEDYLDPKGLMEHYRVAMEWNPPTKVPYTGGLHDFLTTLKKGNHEHGERVQYASPNSDVLGWIIERATNQSIPDLIAAKIWSHIGAESDAWISVDRHGGYRTAGGMCATARDLARFGEALRLTTDNKSRPFPQQWIDDVLTNGSRAAWENGTLSGLFAKGHYRSQWYVPDRFPRTMMAIGIHGQWLYIDSVRQVTIVKLSSQPLPEDDRFDQLTIDLCDAIAKDIASKREPNTFRSQKGMPHDTAQNR